MLGSGIGNLAEVEPVRETLARLGYPGYFAAILGIAKLLGGAALVAPVPRAVREWAYAGVTFELIAAGASYIASGSPWSDVIGPAVVALVVFMSYLSWRSYRGSPGQG